jgi:radical SAM protein with 4Fe4S-binding SPASM domain
VKVRRHSDYYNFIGDTDTGVTFRWGQTLDDDPPTAPWPELADISISNHCSRKCGFCYRNSGENGEFMSVQDYEFVLDSLHHPEWDTVFQIALGGGEPLEPPDFLDIVGLTNQRNIIVNFTTNGVHLTKDLVRAIEDKVSAMALSTHNVLALPERALSLLRESSIRTNLHFLLGQAQLVQAIEILRGNYNDLLASLNAIIFLTYKPVGRAKHGDCLKWNGDLKTFVELIDHHKCSVRIGFDACFVPMLLHATETPREFIDPCECAFFSVYVDENLNVQPCSFANTDDWTFNLRDFSFARIWTEKFADYRNMARNDCRRICANNTLCRGRCPFFEEITFCYSAGIQGTLLL